MLFSPVETEEIIEGLAIVCQVGQPASHWLSPNPNNVAPCSKHHNTMTDCQVRIACTVSVSY